LPDLQNGHTDEIEKSCKIPFTQHFAARPTTIRIAAGFVFWLTVVQQFAKQQSTYRISVNKTDGGFKNE